MKLLSQFETAIHVPVQAGVGVAGHVTQQYGKSPGHVPEYEHFETLEHDVE